MHNLTPLLSLHNTTVFLPYFSWHFWLQQRELHEHCRISYQCFNFVDYLLQKKHVHKLKKEHGDVASLKSDLQQEGQSITSQ